ncbi:diguanylate cyclase domain-containing protein [Sulfuricurvum sp.]|uniref:diguanylate cyclase domain-containing protein n=1 Tax=Sulfuricurvum sp. TaxID=2025608 RepID=UPI002D291EDB|nr:diguanylate cyclase [Sulfuricurvum sp.]HZF70718.1 diguanylate cyclase [Sulfuricurvum sp.]
MENKNFIFKLIGANTLIILLVFGTFYAVFNFLNFQLAKNTQQRQNMIYFIHSCDHVSVNLYQSAMLNNPDYLTEAALSSNNALNFLHNLSKSGFDTRSLKENYYDFFRQTVLTTSLVLEHRLDEAHVADHISQKKYQILHSAFLEMREKINQEQERIIMAINTLMVFSAILLVIIIIANILILFRSFKSIRAKESERSEMIAALGDGVYGINREGNCIFINRSALDMLGFSEEEVIGQNQHRLFHHHRSDGTVYPEKDCPIHLTEQDRTIRHTEETFIRKNGSLLPVSLTVAPLGTDRSIVVFQDITVQKEEQALLDRYANYDALTTLPNRRLFTILAEQMIAQANRDNKIISIGFLDLDGFKQVNDTYGHEVGDTLLQEVAKRFKSTLRQSDLVARFGGDEFVVLLTSINTKNEAELSFIRLISQVSEPIIVNGIAIKVGVSIGYTLYPQDSGDIDLLIRHADIAMYDAKQSGKGRIRRYQNQEII